jgi:hypothetical protein
MSLSHVLSSAPSCLEASSMAVSARGGSLLVQLFGYDDAASFLGESSRVV